MPYMGWLELYLNLQKIAPELPIVFVSGYAPDNAIEEQVLRHGLAFLPKPFHKNDLLKVVKQALGF